MPFALLTLTVLAWGVPAIKSWGTPAAKDWLDARCSWKPEVPWLHLKVAKGAAVTGHEELLPGDLEKAQVDVVPLSSTGTAVFLAAVLSGSLLGLSPLSQARLLAGTIRRMVPAILAIVCMLALGFVTKYSGMDAVLGLAFTRTGRGLYPIFGTLLGWLGVALTGSDTSSNCGGSRGDGRGGARRRIATRCALAQPRSGPDRRADRLDLRACPACGGRVCSFVPPVTAQLILRPRVKVSCSEHSFPRPASGASDLRVCQASGASCRRTAFSKGSCSRET